MGWGKGHLIHHNEITPLPGQVTSSAGHHALASEAAQRRLTGKSHRKGSWMELGVSVSFSEVTHPPALGHVAARRAPSCEL